MVQPVNGQVGPANLPGFDSTNGGAPLQALADDLNSGDPKRIENALRDLRALPLDKLVQLLNQLPPDQQAALGNALGGGGNSGGGNSGGGGNVGGGGGNGGGGTGLEGLNPEDMLQMLNNRRGGGGGGGRRTGGSNRHSAGLPGANGVRNTTPTTATRSPTGTPNSTSPTTRTATTPGQYGPQVDRLFSAITGQESGGNSGAVNRDSGALGIGQVMPANVRAWSREALGHEISPEEFRSRPDLQQQIVGFKLNQYYQEGLQRYGDENTAVRYAAAKWYSGNGENMNSTRPQYSNGNAYPSIASYSNQVLQRYQNA